MKKYIYILLALVAAVATGCREDFKEYDKGSTLLEIAPDKDTLYLDQTEYSSDGLTLTWTSGTNEGTGHRIYYKLTVMQAGTGFGQATSILDGVTETFEKTWTVDDINSLAIELGGEPGIPIALTARIIASGDGFSEQEATCDFVVIPYKPITHTLYLVGNATPGGWTLADATAMDMKEIGYFKTTVKLKKGFFKLICTTDGMLPGYMPGETNEDLVLRSEMVQQDKMWNVTVEHLYEITANLITMKFTMKEVSAVKPDYEDLYLIGNETGWNFWQMDRDPLDPFLFRIGHYWTLGQDFKFGTASGAWENNYKAASDNADFTEEGMQFIKGYDPDPKWFLTDGQCNKMYKICVDIHTSEERMIMREFTPYENIWLVGDAAPGGWSMDDATAMTRTDDSIFTWTGNLTAGALKFSCDRQSDWMGAWFMATSADKEPTGEAEQILFIDKHDNSLTRYQYKASSDVNVDDIDYKWNITVAGKYTITLDQLHDRVTISKQ